MKDLTQNHNVNEQIFLAALDACLRGHAAPFVIPGPWRVTGARVVAQPYTFEGSKQEGAYMTIEVRLEDVNAPQEQG